MKYPWSDPDIVRMFENISGLFLLFQQILNHFHRVRTDTVQIFDDLGFGFGKYSNRDARTQKLSNSET